MHPFLTFVSVGRLDEATTGLLILTTDGGLVHSLASPQAKVPKRYEVTTDRLYKDEAAVQRLREGVEIELETNGAIETYTTAPADAVVESDGRLCIVISEGKSGRSAAWSLPLGARLSPHRRAIGRLDLRDHGLVLGDVLNISDKVLAMVGVDDEDKKTLNERGLEKPRSPRCPVICPG